MRHVRVVVFVRLASACVIAAIRVSRLMPTALSLIGEGINRHSY
jgi:hypothetical protein